MRNHDNESIEEKLKALGVQLGAKNLSPQKKPPKFRIEDVIQVTEEKTPFGSIFVVEEHYPADHKHGNVLLNDLEQFKIIAKWANLDAALAADKESLLFIDTETSGISRGSGTFAFMVGLGFYRADGFHLRQLIMPDPYLEPALLAVLARYTEGCRYIVSYNGKSFDIPLLENRHILHRMPSPFADKQHIDLLHMARKLWRNRLTSRRLGDLENHILSFARTNDDIPGWLVPEIYKEYLNTGDARPLSGVVYHNAVDILSLAGVFVHVSSLLSQPAAKNQIDLDLVAIGNIFEDMGSYEAAKKIYQECLTKIYHNNYLFKPYGGLLQFIKKRMNGGMLYHYGKLLLIMTWTPVLNWQNSMNTMKKCSMRLSAGPKKPWKLMRGIQIHLLIFWQTI
jgi:uncharacterized protein